VVEFKEAEMLAAENEAKRLQTQYEQCVEAADTKDVSLQGKIAYCTELRDDMRAEIERVNQQSATVDAEIQSHAAGERH